MSKGEHEMTSQRAKQNISSLFLQLQTQHARDCPKQQETVSLPNKQPKFNSEDSCANEIARLKSELARVQNQMIALEAKHLADESQAIVSISRQNSDLRKRVNENKQEMSQAETKCRQRIAALRLELETEQKKQIDLVRLENDAFRNENDALRQAKEKDRRVRLHQLKRLKALIREQHNKMELAKKADDDAAYAAAGEQKRLLTAVKKFLQVNEQEIQQREKSRMGQSSLVAATGFAINAKSASDAASASDALSSAANL